MTRTLHTNKKNDITNFNITETVDTVLRCSEFMITKCQKIFLKFKDFSCETA